jgi:molecular chaperone HtpG
MAQLLPEELTTELTPFIGYQLLNIITAGMYDDPLMVYREYVQNAVDSIDLAEQQGKLRRGEGFISILIQGHDRSICVEDNGGGLGSLTAQDALLSLGCSPKEGTNQRGFRGIGRLGGLAYCDLLQFETRSSEEQDVAVVQWDRKALDVLLQNVKKGAGLVEVVKSITRVFRRPASPRDPSHFFRVQMQNVRRFHSDRLMVIKTVRDYLSQVAPVPYDEASFSHTTKVEQHFENVPAYRNYKLFVNDKAVVRPYTDDVQVSLNVRDRIHDVELFELGDAASPLARGWYAVTDYKGSLPVSVAMRGVRVRHGNIEVGDEYFLSAAYLERRFATWMIGEIQICNRNIRPNARRDGFEQTSEYELFLEQTNALGRFLSRLCRKSSSQRCAAQGAAQQLHEIESSLQDLAFFIDEEHKESFLDTMQLKVQRIQDLAETSGDGQHVMNKRQELQSRMESLSGSFSLLRNHIDREVLRCFDSTQVLEIIIKNLHKEYPNSNSFEGLIRKILLPFIKSSPL